MGKILVVGATGAQGGSVARHLLQGKSHTVRCLVRDAGKPAAQRLSASGAELVTGDLDRPDSLKRALAGCTAVFGVTDYWEHFDREYEQARTLADACAEAGIDHLVFSGLPSATALSGGRLEVSHFETKALAEAYIRSLGLPFTFVHVGFYFENFIRPIRPRRQADGSFVIGLPMGETPLAAVSVEDLGGVTAAIFDAPERFIGRTLSVVGDVQPVSVHVQSIERASGCTLRYRHLPSQVFAAFGGFPEAGDLASMFDLYRLHMPSATAALAECRALYPGLRSFDRWAADVGTGWTDVFDPTGRRAPTAAVG